MTAFGGECYIESAAATAVGKADPVGQHLGTLFVSSEELLSHSPTLTKQDQMYPRFRGLSLFLARFFSRMLSNLAAWSSQDGAHVCLVFPTLCHLVIFVQNECRFPRWTQSQWEAGTDSQAGSSVQARELGSRYMVNT